MELADVLDSKSSPGDRVRVRPPPPAPRQKKQRSTYGKHKHFSVSFIFLGENTRDHSVAEDAQEGGGADHRGDLSFEAPQQYKANNADSDGIEVQTGLWEEALLRQGQGHAEDQGDADRLDDP